MQIATKNRAHLGSYTLPVDATGEVHTTPSALAYTLEDVAYLQYKRARFAAHMLATASATVTATLKAGTQTLVSVQLTGTDDAREAVIDLSGVDGQTPITVTYSVDSAGTAGATAQIQAVLDVTSPLVIAGCV